MSKKKKKKDIPNVFIVLGSPRKKGNSTALALEAARGIEEAGGTYELLSAHKARIKPCKACGACKKKSAKRYCAIKDDMEEVYPKLEKADALLIASPIYWFSVSAQTKLFLDRCYALDRPAGNTLTGKRFGFILTYGADDEKESGAVNAIRMYEDALKYLEAENVDIVHGSTPKKGDAESDPQLMEKAYSLGKKLVHRGK